MGRDPQSAVADSTGQVFGMPGLWIGDASALPTASGVNPMITIMALALRTARYVDAML
jgi:choline dehydrogenase-like flavoprotein